MAKQFGNFVKQFRLTSIQAAFQDPEGGWMVVHCPTGNAYIYDGKAIKEQQGKGSAAARTLQLFPDGNSNRTVYDGNNGDPEWYENTDSHDFDDSDENDVFVRRGSRSPGPPSQQKEVQAGTTAQSSSGPRPLKIQRRKGQSTASGQSPKISRRSQASSPERTPSATSSKAKRGSSNVSSGKSTSVATEGARKRKPASGRI